jgi:hypothetical protein
MKPYPTFAGEADKSGRQPDGAGRSGLQASRQRLSRRPPRPLDQGDVLGCAAIPIEKYAFS